MLKFKSVVRFFPAPVATFPIPSASLSAWCSYNKPFFQLLFFPLYFRLKQYVSVQDQPLVNVNKSLWEVMRTCSDEEVILHDEITFFT